VPGTPIVRALRFPNRDGRDKPGHDESKRAPPAL
jgi:hypothetical protein